MNKKSLEENCNIPKNNMKNNNISVEGKKKSIIRKNYYTKYYKRINNVYVVDYRDQNGRFCYRAIYIVPKKITCTGQKYLGSKCKINNIS